MTPNASNSATASGITSDGSTPAAICVNASTARRDKPPSPPEPTSPFKTLIPRQNRQRPCTKTQCTHTHTTSIETESSLSQDDCGASTGARTPTSSPPTPRQLPGTRGTGHGIRSRMQGPEKPGRRPVILSTNPPDRQDTPNEDLPPPTRRRPHPRSRHHHRTHPPHHHSISRHHHRGNRRHHHPRPAGRHHPRPAGHQAPRHLLGLTTPAARQPHLHPAGPPLGQGQHPGRIPAP